MKPYFCTKCGKPYNQKECINDGSKLLCTDCAKGVLTLGGIPILLISVILALVTVLAFEKHPQIAKTHKWLLFIVPPTFFLVGILKIIQQKLLARKSKTANQNNPTRDQLRKKMSDYLANDRKNLASEGSNKPNGN